MDCKNTKIILSKEINHWNPTKSKEINCQNLTKSKEISLLTDDNVERHPSAELAEIVFNIAAFLKDEVHDVQMFTSAQSASQNPHKHIKSSLHHTLFNLSLKPFSTHVRGVLAQALVRLCPSSFTHIQTTNHYRCKNITFSLFYVMLRKKCHRVHPSIR